MSKIEADAVYSEAMQRVMTRAVVSLDDVAVVLGVSRNSAFKASAAGQIETVMVGKLRRAPTAPLREALRLPAVPAEPARMVA